MTDAGGEHDQHGLQLERELRHAEIELRLEGGERDQEGAGEDDLAEPRPGGEGPARGAAHLVALCMKGPGAEHGEGGAADQHQVGRAPEGHVLAADPVPAVVERERRQRARAADRDHQSADRRVPAGGDLERGAGRFVRQGDAEHARGEHAEEPGEDEVVGGVGQRTGVAALIDVQGDVPVHAEDGDQQGDREEGAGQRGPAGQAGDALGEVGGPAEEREPALLVQQDRAEQEDRRHHRAGGGVDHV